MANFQFCKFLNGCNMNINRNHGGFDVVDSESSGCVEYIKDIFQSDQSSIVSQHDHKIFICIFYNGIILAKIIPNWQINFSSMPSIIYNRLQQISNQNKEQWEQLVTLPHSSFALNSFTRNTTTHNRIKNAFDPLNPFGSNPLAFSMSMM